MVSTHLPECPKGCTFTDRSHKGWSVLDNDAPRIPHKLIVSTARDSSDGDVDRSPAQFRNLPFSVFRGRDLSRDIRRIYGYLKDIVQGTPLQELLEIEEQPIRG